MPARHPKASPRAHADPEAGAWVRVIELKASGVMEGLGDKGGQPLRLRAQSAFPWRVLVPLPISPRLRGLILLNLVSLEQRGSATSSLAGRPPAAAATTGHPQRLRRIACLWPRAALRHQPPPPTHRAALQVCLACASAFVVLKESQQEIDPFVFSSMRFVIAAAMFSPFFRQAVKDERVVKAGVEIGAWAAGGARRCFVPGGAAAAAGATAVPAQPPPRLGAVHYSMLRGMCCTAQQPLRLPTRRALPRAPAPCRLPHPEHRHADSRRVPRRIPVGVHRGGGAAHGGPVWHRQTQAQHVGRGAGCAGGHLAARGQRRACLVG